MRSAISQTSALLENILSKCTPRSGNKGFLHYAPLNRAHRTPLSPLLNIQQSEQYNYHACFSIRTFSNSCRTNSHLMQQNSAPQKAQIGSSRNSLKQKSCCRISNDSNKSDCQQRLFFSSAQLDAALSTLPGTVDRYHGVWVDLGNVSKEGLLLEKLSEKEFDTLLKASMESWKDQSVTSAWLKVPITLGKFLPVASKYGFTFHHAEGHQVTLSLWMDKVQGSKIPRFATHQMGVSGLVINEDAREILVVQDKNRPYQLWKFPGGLSDLGEDIAATAEREVFEETGVKTEFQSVLAFRQQHSHPGAFGRSDLYVLCRLKPLTFDLHPCEEEIAACQWMSIDRLKDEVHASSLTHKLADLVILGLEQGFSHVDITSYEMASIYKGLKFHIFHRPLQR